METVTCSFKLPVNTCITITGKSTSGKSRLTKELISQNLFEESFSGIIVVREGSTENYGNPTKIFENFSDFENFFTKNIDKLEKFLIILDDVDLYAYNSLTISKLSKVYCHHKNITLIIISQTIFVKAKYSVEINRNIGVQILFENYRDTIGINILSSQIGRPHFLQQCFDLLGDSSYKYIVLNFKPHCSKLLRVTSGYLLNESKIVFKYD